MELDRIRLYVNGVDRYATIEPAKDTLADVLRRLGLTGVKVGCGIGVCGACSVILNGKVVRSCTTMIKNVPADSKITTIEGLGTAEHLHPLQQAWITYGGVQCGFCTPGFIVSAKQLLAENPAPTREEVRQWFYQHRNICRCTGYKPIVDAVMAAAAVMRGEKTMDDITWHAPADNEIYGSAMPRPGALSRVLGLADFGDDVAAKMPENTLEVALVQPRKYHHAKILGIDTGEAEKMTGVYKIVTAKDLYALGGTNMIAWKMSHKRNKGTGEMRPILADKKILRYGDVVALVCADTRDHARQAAAAVKVELEQLPEYTSALEAVMPDAMSIHENVPNIYEQQPLFKDEGPNADKDTRDVLEQSPYMVEGSFYTQREPHLSIEGDILQAYWDPDGLLTVQGKAQAVGNCKTEIGPGIGLTKDKIRIIMNASGASFGWSTSSGSFALIAAATAVTGMPCNLSMSYLEHQHYSGKRSPAYFNARMACDKDGKITAYEFESAIDHGTFAEKTCGLMDRFTRFNGFPYYIPKVSALNRMVFVNHSFGTSYRGFGAPQSETCSEQIVDMLAAKMGMDPFEFRYKNILRPGDTSMNSYPYGEYPMVAIFDKMRPLYYEAKERAAKESTPEKRRGVGVSCGGFSVSSGKGDSSGVALELMPDGSFTHYSTWEDIGQGGDVGVITHTVEALKPLGVTPDMVHEVMNDSKLCPDSGIAGGSRSHFMVGNATIIAANQLMDAMRKSDGTYRTYAEMKAEGIETKYSVRYSNTVVEGLCGLNPNDGHGNPSPTIMYGLFMAEVEVDVKTGKTKVLKLSSCFDVGPVGNKLTFEGQAFGGNSHAIGYALSEDYEDVKKHGNIATCGVPTIEDIPDDMPLYQVNTPRKWGPHGSAGCSELFQSGNHMCVINAIYNACGVRIYEMPATPAKVKAGLDKLARGEAIEPPHYFLGSDMYETLEEMKENPV